MHHRSDASERDHELPRAEDLVSAPQPPLEGRGEEATRAVCSPRALPQAPHEFRKVRLADVDLEDLTFQVRVEMRLGDLTQSLQETGQLEPVHLLGPAPYRVIDGFRRCTAARALGWSEIEAAVFVGLEERLAFRFAFAHNAVRRNLRSIDKANAIRLAMKAGLSRFDTAVDLKMSEKQVGRYLALLRLPRDVQDAIDEKQFTMGHALVLAAFDVGNVEQVVREVRSRRLTVPQLRRLLQQLVGGRRPAGRRAQIVSRDGRCIRFRGEVSLTAPKAEREHLASQLLRVVGLLQRGED